MNLLAAFPIFFLFFYPVFFLLPVLGIHSLVRLFFYAFKQKTNLNDFGSFYFTFLVLPVIVNIAWWAILYNKVYYYWDSLGMYYTFTEYEQPGPWLSDWILPGWEYGLYIIWLIATILIYLSTLIVSYYMTKNKKNSSVINKVNVVTILIFAIFSSFYAFFRFNLIEFILFKLF